jgi:hypothetical protein
MEHTAIAVDLAKSVFDPCGSSCDLVLLRHVPLRDGSIYALQLIFFGYTLLSCQHVNSVGEAKSTRGKHLEISRHPNPRA